MIRNLETIQGIGPKTLQKFRNLGIWHTYDLVLTLPKRYDNFSVKDYESLKHDTVVTVVGKIRKELKSFKKKVILTTTNMWVGDYTVNLLIFGRGYLDKQIKIDDEVIVRGKFNLYKNEINVEYISTKIEVPEIKPVYQLEGISEYQVVQTLNHIFKEDLVDIYEILPLDFVKKFNLMDRKTAILTAHFPKTNEDLERATYRFKVEEAFLHLLKYHLEMPPATLRKPVSYNISKVKKEISKLPYQLTMDQQEAVNDIFRDFKKETSIYRLIQGDVGTGKTLVTFIASIGSISAGYQVAFLAPTEILAKQHYETFNYFFKDYKSAVLTSSVRDKKTVLESLETGDIDIIFGTHILGSPQTNYKNLGLVIIDEQHKFGVEQRSALIKKSQTSDTIYLSATPIPRSLSLTYFGDLDVSTIHQKPVLTPPIETHLVSDKDISRVIDILKNTQQKNEQSFIVVPAILEGNKTYTIHSVYAILESHFKADDFYVVHGKLKPEEIEMIMVRFMNNPKGILLSTTIIEVGIDVKNATTMVIMGAENFGLSSLHQLRGRVGRGKKPGNCYLVSPKTDIERLSLLKSTTDGFILSGYDLKLRGPGIFSNIIQSGHNNFKYIDLNSDLVLLQNVVKAVKYYKAHIERYAYLRKVISNVT